MLFEKSLPKFDLPVDFLAADEVFSDILTYYSKFPCKIKSLIFVMCKQGSIRANINHKEYTIVPGDFVTLIPNTFIQIHEVKGEVKLIFAGFSSGFIEEMFVQPTQLNFYPNIWEYPLFHPSEEVYNFYNKYFTLLINGSIHQEISFNRHALKGILLFIAGHLATAYKKYFQGTEHKLGRGNQILRDFLRLLHENYQTEHSVSFYAEKSNITFQHFCKTIKQVSGKTPSEIINNFLIMDAKSYLKSSSRSVKDIAISLGFQNTSFFSKFFKSHTGMTPQEYRNK
ncbi:MAG: AraC family transcriptional regulator [Tannerellaceae bacterium]|nr:AraC family transcriptional regulator [Tannerellaceae bacterium]